MTEMAFYSNRTVSGFDYDPLEKTMKRIVKEEQPFERLEISKEDLLRLFGVSHLRYSSQSTMFHFLV